MQKETKDQKKSDEKKEEKTFYGLEKDISLLSVEFAPPENPDLRE
ncbi:hypothetical protein [Neobacillus piezotolerans]|nr:hypothetical protein [Neobacillus piezotolerans]